MFELEISVDKDGPSYGTAMAMSIKAVQEPMIHYHFGEGDYIDDVFDMLGKLIDEEIAKEEFSLISYILHTARINPLNHLDMAIKGGVNRV
ncbi:SAM dependent carboxyl methyltransferase [Macleaya cordata]|uniref:SAM dependent carboxyl methyltransferase n=1 Tax=Macleaya cordata TaxID=56857 RepID=A0A200QT89_MACCD|nr:SAM dependent carboxyl methyltransferase [Macleaya cordata]